MGSTGASFTYQVLKDHIGLAFLSSFRGKTSPLAAAVITPLPSTDGKLFLKWLWSVIDFYVGRFFTACGFTFESNCAIFYILITTDKPSSFYVLIRIRFFVEQNTRDFYAQNMNSQVYRCHFLVIPFFHVANFLPHLATEVSSANWMLSIKAPTKQIEYSPTPQFPEQFLPVYW